jgi:hypothetical protein
MNVENLVDLYTDYLIVSPGQATATGLSAMIEGRIGHDQVTRLLASGVMDSSALWKEVKPICWEIGSAEGVLIIDDSVEEKKYTSRNELICWHYDHTQGRSVKGVNFLTALYYSQDVSMPVSVEWIKKNQQITNKKTGKITYKSVKTKNEYFREMVERATGQIDFKYVLADSWFSGAENLTWVVNNCKKDFIIAIKENRKAALSEADKQAGSYSSIQDMELEGCVQRVYMEQLEFPVFLTKQVLKNGDGSTGTLYLATSDGTLSAAQITAIYQKRWKVEEYHKSVKSNASFAKSPTRTVVTQTSHFIAAIMAFVKLERLKVRNCQNHFAMKTQIMIAAAKAAYEEYLKLSTPIPVLTKFSA